MSSQVIENKLVSDIPGLTQIKFPAGFDTPLQIQPISAGFSSSELPKSLRNLLGSNTQATVEGFLRLPSDQLPVGVQPDPEIYPWEIMPGVEGIHAQVSLKQPISLGNAKLSNLKLGIYRATKTSAYKLQLSTDLIIQKMGLSISLKAEVDSASDQLTFEEQENQPGGAWALDLGLERLYVNTLRLVLKSPANGKTTGELSGTAAFGKVKLPLKLAIPGECTFQADCKQIAFNDLAKRFGDTGKLFPSGFDPKVKDAQLLIKSGSQGLLLQVGGRVNQDTFQFQATKQKQGKPKWGFAAGLAMTDPKLSKLPGLSALKPIEKVVQFQKLAIVASNFSASNFALPPVGSLSVQPGLVAQGVWKLDNANKQLKLLRTMFGLQPQLAASLFVAKEPSKGSKLQVDYQTKVNKWPLSCQLGVGLNAGEPELFLDGTLEAKIQKQACVFDVAMQVQKSGLALSGTMQGTVAFSGIQLSNPALLFGMNWGGIPSLGVAGVISSRNFTGSLAVLFDSKTPTKSLLAGAVTELSLLDIAQEFAKAKKIPSEMRKTLDQIGLVGGQPFYLPKASAVDLDERDLPAVASAFSKAAKISIPSQPDQVLLVVKQPGKEWHLTDLKNRMQSYQISRDSRGIRVSLDTQLYVAPQASQIGALKFAEGYYFSGAVDLLGFKWETQVDVSVAKGIAIDSSMNKALVIYKPSFFKLSDVQGKKGPRLSLATFNQPSKKEKEFRKPHIYLNGKASLLGLEQAALMVQVTEHGFAFLLEQNQTLRVGCSSLSGSVTGAYKINASFDSPKDFDAGGQANLAIKGKVALGKMGVLNKAIPGSALNKLGSVSLNLQVDGTTQARYRNNRASGEFRGSFVFAKQRHSISTKLNVEDKAFAQLGDKVYGEIKTVLAEIVKDAERWLQAVEGKLIQGVDKVEQVGTVFKDVYRKSAKDTAKILRRAGKSTQQVGTVLKSSYRLTASQAAKALSDAGATVDEIGSVLKNTYKQSGEQAAKIFKSLGKGSQEVAKTLKNTFKMSANSVGKTLKSTYRLSKNELNNVLKGAGFASKEVSKFVGSAFKKMKKWFR